MNTEEVCGYRNFETATVALLLANSQPLYDQCLYLARLHQEDESFLGLADDLESLIEESLLRMDDREGACGDEGDGLAYTLLSAAVDRVDWRELAEEWLTTVKEEMKCDSS